MSQRALKIDVTLKRHSSHIIAGICDREWKNNEERFRRRIFFSLHGNLCDIYIDYCLLHNLCGSLVILWSTIPLRLHQPSYKPDLFNIVLLSRNGLYDMATTIQRYNLQFHHFFWNLVDTGMIESNAEQEDNFPGTRLRSWILMTYILYHRTPRWIPVQQDY